jgi:hypothetical protein
MTMRRHCYRLVPLGRTVLISLMLLKTGWSPLRSSTSPAPSCRDSV